MRRVVGVRDATHVHELDEERAAPVVHGVGDHAPPRDVLVGVDARGVQVALTVVGGLSALGDEQAERCALSVVLSDERPGCAVRLRPIAGHRREREPMVELDPAEGERLPEGFGCHEVGPSSCDAGVVFASDQDRSRRAWENGSALFPSSHTSDYDHN